MFRLATASLTLLLLSCSETPRTTHVVLISIDSLRADHLGAYGYPRATSPSIDRLARQGTLFERALSSTTWTLPAHVALFTGLDDDLHGVTDASLGLASDLPTLAERLQQAGFVTGAVVSGPFLHPRFGMNRGFDDYLNCMSFLDDQFRPRRGKRLDLHRASHADVTGDCVVVRAKRWLTANRDRKAFLFLHFWDVHHDYTPPPAVVERFDPDYAGELDFSDFAHNEAIAPDMAPRDLEHLIALYDGEIAETDAQVGEVLGALEQLGLARSSLVILTSDHGDAFFEHGEKGHKKDLHAETLRIPLLLRGPGVAAGVRRAGPAHITDVAPTLLDLLGLPPLAPGGVGTGRSLVPALGDPAALEGRRVYARLRDSETDQAALEGLEGKLIRDRRAESLQFYALASDPGEETPMEASGEWRRRLDAYEDELAARAAALPGAEVRGVDPALAERLRELGYAE